MASGSWPQEINYVPLRFPGQLLCHPLVRVDIPLFTVPAKGTTLNSF